MTVLGQVTRLDSDRFSVIRSRTTDNSSSSESVNQSVRNDNANRETESVNDAQRCSSANSNIYNVIFTDIKVLKAIRRIKTK